MGIRRISDDIKAQSGWFGDLNSPLRFIVSAMLYANDDGAAEFLAEIETVRQMFRTARLRRGGIYETMAILIMRLQADKQPIATSTVDRFQAIYEEMKRHHWWLTGPDDFSRVCHPRRSARVRRRDRRTHRADSIRD